MYVLDCNFMNVVAYSNIFVVLITNKATVSQRSFQKNIDKNPLQQLDISKFFFLSYIFTDCC